MKKITFTLTLLVLFFISSPSAEAQRLGSNDAFYHSFRSPLSTRLNPALFPASSNWYVTLPRVGAGLTLPISYNQLGLQYDAGSDTTTLNVNNLLRTLDSCGSRFSVNADVDLFGFGFRTGRLSFNVATGIRVTGGLCVPLGAARLATEGNAGSAEPIEMGCSDFFHAQAFGYASLGAAYTLPSDDLAIGARVNLLDGIATLSADNLSLLLTTQDDGQALQASADYLLHSAGMVYLQQDEAGKFGIGCDSVSLSSLPAANLGVTFDLGVRYTIGDFNLSASLLDFGPGIHWTHHTTTIVPKHQDATLSFDGLDLSSLLTNGQVDTAFASRLTDSLLSLVDYETQSSDFWAGIPTRLYLGASYSLNNLLRVGFLLHGEWDRGLFAPQSTFRCSNTLSATANLFDWLDLTVANALSFDGAKADLFNPGVAFSLNISRVVQFYLSLDYLSNLYVTDMKSVRLFCGLNIVGKSRN